jgi:osmoprotectant transport system ATP-binding protein
MVPIQRVVPDVPASPAIEFDHVTIRYGSMDVIRDLTLRIERGSFVVLLGPSGSGKTTLLRAINRMVEPTEGRVLIDGKDVASEKKVELRRSIGYVMQSSGLFPHRTVVENVATVPRLTGMGKAAARALARATLARVGLEESLGGRYPAQLSGGQQQRVGVARALATDPDILLMDEPFGAVDPITRRALQLETLRLHKATGATVVFVTHDVDEALLLADRVIVLGTDGRVAQDGTPAHLLTNPASEFVAELLGTTSGDRILHVEPGHGADVVYDRTGRPVGVLER